MFLGAIRDTMQSEMHESLPRSGLRWIMMKQILMPITALCLLGLFLSPLSAQQASLKVGDRAPDFEVDTLAGEKFKLSDRFGEDGGATILLFSRANW